jgi:hypothetical protein
MRRLTVVSWPLVAALVACSPAAVPADAARAADPDAVAASLVFAAETICIPYVVDGRPIDQLVDRAGITRRVGYSHGILVTRYVIDAPGQPVVTPSPAANFGAGPDGTPVHTDISCSADAVGAATLEFERQVSSRLRERLAQIARPTKPPHPIPEDHPAPSLEVVCILGPTPALVSTNNPDWAAGDPVKQFLAKPVGGLVNVDIHSHEESEGCP